MGVHLPKQQCRPIYLYCQRIFSRPAFLKSLTLQEKNHYQSEFKQPSENIMSDQEKPYADSSIFSCVIYEWICDNQLTPHLLVDATQPNTLVPEQFIEDGQIA